MEKIPIIILHGWNLSANKFTGLSNLLVNEKYKVLCPDLLGFGPSEKPKTSLILDDYVEFVVLLMKKNRIARANFIWPN